MKNPIEELFREAVLKEAELKGCLDAIETILKLQQKMKDKEIK